MIYMMNQLANWCFQWSFVCCLYQLKHWYSIISSVPINLFLFFKKRPWNNIHLCRFILLLFTFAICVLHLFRKTKKNLLTPGGQYIYIYIKRHMFHGYSLNNHVPMRHRMEHQSTVIQRMTFVKSFTCVDNRPQELYHSWPVDVW